jgi:hypothetical protein
MAIEAQPLVFDPVSLEEEEASFFIEDDSSSSLPPSSPETVALVGGETPSKLDACC